MFLVFSLHLVSSEESLRPFNKLQSAGWWSQQNWLLGKCHVKDSQVPLLLHREFWGFTRSTQEVWNINTQVTIPLTSRLLLHLYTAESREKDSWSKKQSRKTWNPSCWNSLLPHYFWIWSKMINTSVSWTCLAMFPLLPLTFVFCLLILNLCDSGAGSCHDCSYCTLLGQLWMASVASTHWANSVELTQSSSRNCIFNFFLLLLEKF